MLVDGSRCQARCLPYETIQGDFLFGESFGILYLPNSGAMLATCWDKSVMLGVCNLLAIAAVVFATISGITILWRSQAK
ncbi:MAG: hypothetical protein LDL41_10045 [Coleofasciculus sp. S288]|nr:hypothetical protein [Coleofasciculus sp. S288]